MDNKGTTPKSKNQIVPKDQKKSNLEVDLKKSSQHWLTEEDLLISVLVQKFGTRKWNIIAEQLKSRIQHSQRNGKQCRERWNNHLDPTVRKSSWDQNEEFIFIEAHKIHGNKWAEIAKYLPGRTDNAIKNHFYSNIRKLISRVAKFEVPKEVYSDEQTRDHIKYLINFLEHQLTHSIANQQNNQIPTARENQNQPTGAKHTDNFQQDIYLQKQLQEKQISSQMFKNYLKKFNDKAYCQRSPKWSDQSAQESEDNEDSLNRTVSDVSQNEDILKKRTHGQQNSTNEVQDIIHGEQINKKQIIDINQNGQFNPIKYITIPSNVAPIFKITKDSQRLIDREIQAKKRENIVNVESVNNSQLLNNQPPSAIFTNTDLERVNDANPQKNSRIRNIVDRKQILDLQHQKDIDENRCLENILDLLKECNITPKLN